MSKGIQQSALFSTLVDCGTNGGVLGDDARILSYLDRAPVTVEGIDQHQILNLSLVNAAIVVHSHGVEEVVTILHKYALHGKGRTTHSSLQLEYGSNVHTTPLGLGGKQLIE